MTLEIGLTPWLEDGSAPLHGEQAERAEGLGFHSYWVPESHFTGSGAIPAPLLLLAAAAARTTRLKLGTTSYLLPVRNPIQGAEEVAVLDQLCGGRLILGVGRGFRSALFKAYDIPVTQKRERFGRVLAAMQSAWMGEPLAFDGEEAPVHLSPLPVQKPHPPIWVAAFGPKAIAQVGGLGLPYLASPMEPLSVLVDNYAQHREAIPSALHDPALPVPVMRTIFVSHDPAVYEPVREAVAAQVGALARSNTASLRRAGEADVDSVTLIGRPEHVAAGIRHYRDQIGVTHLIARVRVPAATTRDVEASLELLAELRGSDSL